MRVVAISDTHGFHDQMMIPHGDILVHAGDFTNYGGEDEVNAFHNWVKALPHKHKLIGFGNHDLHGEPLGWGGKYKAVKDGVTYAWGCIVEAEGVKLPVEAKV